MDKQEIKRIIIDSIDFKELTNKVFEIIKDGENALKQTEEAVLRNALLELQIRRIFSELFSIYGDRFVSLVLNRLREKSEKHTK